MMAPQHIITPEHQRLREPFTGVVRPWYHWGPYVSERSWGTVREDYSAKVMHGTFFRMTLPAPKPIAGVRARRAGVTGSRTRSIAISSSSVSRTLFPQAAH
jgi:hypothetical protein